MHATPAFIRLSESRHPAAWALLSVLACLLGLAVGVPWNSQRSLAGEDAGAAAGTEAGKLKRRAHPFLLWTAEEAAAIKKRIETEDWAKRALKDVQGSGGQKQYGAAFASLLRYSALGDEKAGQKEKKILLSFIGAKIDHRPWYTGYMHALRYDVLHDLLTEEERGKVADTFRKHIDFEIHKDKKNYTKLSWLPNMQWPRKMGAGLMAIVLQDEARIRGIFACNGGWKYYFDDYLSDGRFYNEEFGKQYSMTGEMLLWCRGLDRLGLPEMGYGYTGSGGATMKRYLMSYFDIGYPQVDLGGGLPHIGHMSMGDAKGGNSSWGYGFQQAIAPGHAPHDPGGLGRRKKWVSSNMNGRDHRHMIVGKFGGAHWFEIAHQKWPDAGFGWWLYQLRAPGEDVYYPSPFFGLEPIQAGAVTPPPAPSGAYPERGIAMLRAVESPAYWTSPAPAAGIRFGTEYVHHAKDAFTIAGFYAYNRPIFVNRQVSPGYAGTDPTWSANIRGHSGVMVDNLEPAFIGEIPLRSHFGAGAKFVAGRGAGVFPEVAQTRAFVLTREYMLDLFRLDSSYPRNYLWQVQTLGHACPDRPSLWGGTSHLVGSSPDLRGEQSRVVGDAPWAVTVTQVTAGADPELSGLGKSWFEDRVGVRVWMLGSPGTVAYHAWGPAFPGIRLRMNEGAEEPGGQTVLAARTAAATTFAAVHEPFRKVRTLEAVTKVAETAAGIAVRVAGGAARDRVLVRYDDKPEEALTLEGEGEVYTFTGYAWLRVQEDRVEAEGEVASFRIHPRGEGAPRPTKLVLNGKEHALRAEEGALIFGDAPAAKAATSAAAANAVADAPAPAGPVAARWRRPLVAIPTGGSESVELALSNAGRKPVTTTVGLTASAGLSVEPATVKLDGLAPGAEQVVAVKVRGVDPKQANRLGRIGVVAQGGAGGAPEPNGAEDAKAGAVSIEVQSATLKVAHGVCMEWSQPWPRQQVKRIYAPRYAIGYDFLDRSGATWLLDPAGKRRYHWDRKGGHEVYPRLRVLEAPKVDSKSKGDGNDKAAKPAWRNVRLGTLMYWHPHKRGGQDGKPAYFVNSGTHPHQPHGVPLEYRWTEDWILAWYRFPAERVALDWSSKWSLKRNPLAEAKRPGATLAYMDGKVQTVEIKKLKGKGLRALFHRPDGFEYGEATFYPEGSTYETVSDRDLRGGRWVSTPADLPTAFAFCTEDELPALVEKWLQSEFGRAKPRGQGDMD